MKTHAGRGGVEVPFWYNEGLAANGSNPRNALDDDWNDGDADDEAEDWARL